MKMLIVDDSTVMQRKIQRSITLEQVTDFLTASNGMEAVEIFRQELPELVTMDLTMPNKDGKTAIHEILTESPEARIMVISAVKGNTVLECLNRGAKGYIEKPLKFSDPLFVEDFKQSVDEVFN